MLKNKILFLLLLLILVVILIPKITWADPYNSALQLSQVELSNVRFVTRTDAVTGEKNLRIVVETTGPVQASASLSSWRSSRLTIAINGASDGLNISNAVLDGDIASDMSIISCDKANSQLVINLPVMISDSDYRVFTLPNDEQASKPFRVVIDINKPAPPPALNFTPGLKGKIIAIDPGHGGSDSGAIGPGKTEEKTVTLAVALQVKTLLEQAGAKVYMTRMDDRDVYAPNDSAVDELGARALIGNENKADIFLDIHANSFQNPKVGGTGTYYYQKSIYDKLLAQSLQEGAVNVDGLTNRGIYPANFYVLKHTLMPSSLIELAFISNPNEEIMLNSPPFQQKIAQGIVNGLENFFMQASKVGDESDAS